MGESLSLKAASFTVEMLCQRGPVRLAFHPNRSRQRPLPGDIGCPCIYLPRHGLVHSLVALPCLGCSWFAYISSIRGHRKTKTPPTICHWHQRSWGIRGREPGKTFGSGGDFGGLQSPCHTWRDICRLPRPCQWWPNRKGARTYKNPIVFLKRSRK